MKCLGIPENSYKQMWIPNLTVALSSNMYFCNKATYASCTAKYVSTLKSIKTRGGLRSLGQKHCT